MAVNYFTKTIRGKWNGLIVMQTVKGEPDMRELVDPIPCGNFYTPIEFRWNGSSVPFGFNAVFPRHRHPIASCKHDFRCSIATNSAERKFADQEFKIDVGRTSWKLTSAFGYFGVRLGALFGIGNRF